MTYRKFSGYLTAIGHGRRHSEREGKALRCLTFGKRARKRAFRYNAQSRWLTREQRLACDAENEAEENALLARAAKNGVVLICMGPRGGGRLGEPGYQSRCADAA